MLHYNSYNYNMNIFYTSKYGIAMNTTNQPLL